MKTALLNGCKLIYGWHHPPREWSQETYTFDASFFFFPSPHIICHPAHSPILIPYNPSSLASLNCYAFADSTHSATALCRSLTSFAWWAAVASSAPSASALSTVTRSLLCSEDDWSPPGVYPAGSLYKSHPTNLMSNVPFFSNGSQFCVGRQCAQLKSLLSRLPCSRFWSRRFSQKSMEWGFQEAMVFLIKRDGCNWHKAPFPHPSFCLTHKLMAGGGRLILTSGRWQSYCKPRRAGN